MNKATVLKKVCDGLTLHDIMHIKHIVMLTVDFKSFNELERIIKTKKNDLQLWAAVADNVDKDLMTTARELDLLSDNNCDNASLAM